MADRKWTRRDFLRIGALAGVGAVLAACAPKVVEKVVEKEVTKIVKEVVKETVMVAGTPQVVEKEVTKIVKETVIVEKAKEMPVELQFICFGWGKDENWPHGKWETEKAEEYMELHPLVTIDTQAAGWDFATKNIIAIAAGNPPNVQLRTSETSILSALEGNCALELEYKQELIDDLSPEWYEGIKYFGKHYHFPFYKLGNGYAANLTLIREAGAEDLLPPPPERAGWDFDQLLELMKAVSGKKADGSQDWGYVFTTSRTNPYFYWPDEVLGWNFGWHNVKVHENLEYECVQDTEASRAFLQWLYDLWDVHHVMPNPAGLDDAVRSGYWNQGDLLGRIGPDISWARRPYTKFDPETLIVTDEEHGFDFVFVEPPVGPYAEHPNCWGGPTMDVNVMPYRTRDRLAIAPSIDFCEFLINKENQDFVAQFQFPARESSAVKVKDPMVLWHLKHYIPYGRNRDGSPGGQVRAVCVALEQAYQRLFLPSPVEEVAAEFCKTIDALEPKQL